MAGFSQEDKEFGSFNALNDVLFNFREFNGRLPGQGAHRGYDFHSWETSELVYPISLAAK